MRAKLQFYFQRTARISRLDLCAYAAQGRWITYKFFDEQLLKREREREIDREKKEIVAIIPVTSLEY
jgi:hypothetical protein